MLVRSRSNYFSSIATTLVRSRSNYACRTKNQFCGFFFWVLSIAIERTTLLTTDNTPLAYKFKTIVGRADFSDQSKKIIICYKRIGYNLNIMRQSACLVLNQITVNNFASLFHCTSMGRASDSMMAQT